MDIVNLLIGIFRALLVGNIFVKAIALLFLGGLVYLFFKWERDIRKKRENFDYFSATLHNERKTLHLFRKGLKPKNIATSLEGFNQAKDVIHFVYEKYDETLYDTLLIHTEEHLDPKTFIYNDSKTKNENIILLHNLMFSENQISIHSTKTERI